MIVQKHRKKLSTKKQGQNNLTPRSSHISINKEELAEKKPSTTSGYQAAP